MKLINFITFALLFVAVMLVGLRVAYPGFFSAALLQLNVTVIVALYLLSFFVFQLMPKFRLIAMVSLIGSLNIFLPVFLYFFEIREIFQMNTDGWYPRFETLGVWIIGGMNTVIIVFCLFTGLACLLFRKDVARAYMKMMS